MGSRGISPVHKACTGIDPGDGIECDSACGNWDSDFSPGWYVSSGYLCVQISEPGTFLGESAETFYGIYYLDSETGSSAVWRGNRP